MEKINTIQFTRISDILTDNEQAAVKLLSNDNQLTVSTTDQLFEQLLSNKANVGYCPMPLMPLQLPEGLVITAISKRYQAGFTLFCNPDHQETTKLLNLKEGVTVGCSSALQAAQLKDFRNDVAVEVYPSWVDALKFFKTGDLAAIVLPTSAIQFAGLVADEGIQLNPKEFVPPSGDGFVGYVCRKEDKVLRRQLTALHHAESVEANNLERQFKRLVPSHLQDCVGVYCEQDANDFYHGNAVQMNGSEVQYGHCSASTSGGFAAALWARISG